MNAFDAERSRLQAAFDRSMGELPETSPALSSDAFPIPQCHNKYHNKCHNLPLIKVGLVGCGYWGPDLARQFQQLGDAQLVALCDLCPDRLLRMGQAHPQAWLTQKFKNLLVSELDAIAIATPARSHYILAKQALEAGKHVLVKKPLAATLDEAQELTDLAQQHNLVLMVGHPFEYSPAIEKVRAVITSGELGPIHYIDSVRVNLGLLRPDINVLWDMAIHEVSMLDYLLGSSALQVSTAGKACTFPELGLHDVATLTLRYPQNQLATIRVSWLEPIKRRTLTIVGRHKTLVYDETAEFTVKLYDSTVEVETVDQSSNHAADWPVRYRRGNKKSYALPAAAPLSQLSQHFLDCIVCHRLGKTDLPHRSAQVGLAAVRTLEAAQQSLEAEGAWVDVKHQTLAPQGSAEIPPLSPLSPLASQYEADGRHSESPHLPTNKTIFPLSPSELSPSDRIANLNELVGIVVVGRNQGDRLRRTLNSSLVADRSVIYVDSGSTDGSVALAHSLGAEVVELSPHQAFTKARAYNRGVERLQKVAPNVEFVQLLDGGCKLMDHWLERAFISMEIDRSIAIICGRRREEFRTRNVFHRLIDMEWNTRIGELTECRAEGLMRLSLFNQFGGFDERLIAGEESELCLRLRQAGGKVMRINADVSLHDAQMSQVSQWWQRTLHNGYAMAERVYCYGVEQGRLGLKQSLSIWLWALVIPSLAMAFAIPTQGMSLLGLLGLYAARIYRIARYRHLAHGDAPPDAWLYACFCLLGKLPELQGQIEFWLRLALGKRRGSFKYNPIQSQR